MRRRITHDIANKTNAMLGMTTRPLYFVSFPISRNTSLASCTAKITDPTRANLPERHTVQIFRIRVKQRHTLYRKLEWKSRRKTYLAR
jgi:hypothetical protein